MKKILYKLIPNECQRKTVNRQWSTLNVGTLSIHFRVAKTSRRTYDGKIMTKNVNHFSKKTEK